MAIQTVNIGTTPNDGTGDTPRAVGQKFNDNFSNTGHAASKLTGTADTAVPLVSDIKTSLYLGTVSQSGGIPTGSIIERGTNANGEYVKLADGTLITHSAVALNYTALTDYPYTLPATLAVTANASVIVSVDNNASFDYQYSMTLNSTTQVTFRSNANAGGVNTLRFSVIGRWF